MVPSPRPRDVRGRRQTPRRRTEVPMLLRYPATALTGLALALASGPQPAPTPAPPAAPSHAHRPGASRPGPGERSPGPGDPGGAGRRPGGGGPPARAGPRGRAGGPPGLVTAGGGHLAEAGRLERPESSPLWLQAAETMRRLAAAHKDLSPGERLALSSALYNEACARAVDGQAREGAGGAGRGRRRGLRPGGAAGDRSRPRLAPGIAQVPGAEGHGRAARPGPGRASGPGGRSPAPGPIGSTSSCPTSAARRSRGPTSRGRSRS